MKKRYRDYPPNVPRKLIKLYRSLGTVRAMEAELKVNTYYICKLMNDGVEPANPEIRAKLFLPKPKKPRVIKEHPAQLTIEWWDTLRKQAVRSMARRTNKAVIKDWRS